MNAAKVSIILPVFNAPEDLRRCLDSVRSHTPAHTPMLLINDGSTDSQIEGIIADFLTVFPSATLLENDENIGFVKTCNRGFAATSGQDVILLNSDTIVTQNWVQKMTEAAYSAPNVATVTPLTNNGTISSVPTWLVENEIPEGFTIDSFASFIEKISLCYYPAIPTGVGFCMYVRRAMLEEVGYFNEVEFDKGYGEENDLCYRANSAGYTHLIDDRTYIFHAGGKSFGLKKQQIIEANGRKLGALHPTYHQDIADYIEKRPMSKVLDNIALRLLVENTADKASICFVLHNAIDEAVNHPLGGTELLCKSIVADIQTERFVYVIYPNWGQMQLTLNLYYQGERQQFSFDCPGLKNAGMDLLQRDPSFQTLFSSLLSALNPDVLHIHHLINLPILEVTETIQRLSIPVVLSLHDYYFICPSYTLIDRHNRFCVDYKSKDYCADCIQSLFRKGTSLRADWKAASLNFLDAVDLAIAPSHSCASYYIDEYAAEFSAIKDLLKVIPHGLDEDYLQQTQLPVERPALPNAEPRSFTVGFVGALDEAKGGHVVSELILRFWKDLPNRSKVSFKIVGEANIVMPRSCRNFVATGRYLRSDLPDYLADIDVVVFCSQWAETYCLTADEVLACGVPIITTPLGAVPERVKSSQAGWITQDSSSDAIAQVILKCLDDPNTVKRKTAAAAAYRPTGMSAVSERYLTVYAGLIEDNPNASENALSLAEASDRSELNAMFLSAYYAAKGTIRSETPFSGSLRFPYLNWLKRRVPRVWAVTKKIGYRTGLLR